MSEEISDHLEWLSCNQAQADMDGVMVTVSRQALDGVITELKDARLRINEAVDRINELEQERDNWIDTAKQHATNEDYYRNLLVICGETIGSDAYLSDDGSVREDVLCIKIPELVASLKEQVRVLKIENDNLRQKLEHMWDAISRRVDCVWGKWFDDNGKVKDD